MNPWVEGREFNNRNLGQRPVLVKGSKAQRFLPTAKDYATHSF